MLSTQLPDPFRVDAVRDPWNPPPGDVAYLQKAAFERWKQLTGQVCQTGTTASLVVYGDAGSGKTQLLARYREWLPTSGLPCVLVWAKQDTVATLWRTLRASLFRELFRGRPGGGTEFERLLQARFPNWQAGASREGITRRIIGAVPVSTVLARHLDGLSQTCQLDRSTRTVLPRLFHQDTLQTAKDWLRGEDLEPEALECLGLPARTLTDLEREEQSKQVVKTMCRLAGRKFVLCFCFDQIEGLQSGVHDATSLCEFAKMVFEVVEEPQSAVLAVSLIQSHVLQSLEVAAHRAYIDRLKQHSAFIPSLTWEQAVAVVVARLDAEPGVRAERQGRPDVYWPLGEPFLRKLFAENALSLMPRHLIKACSTEFHRLQQVGPAAETGVELLRLERDGTDKRTESVDDLGRAWEGVRRGYLAQPQGVQFDKVIELGFPWLAEIVAPEFVRVRAISPRLGDVNLLFQPTKVVGAVGISCCNQEPRKVWHRFRRLLKQWEDGRGTLVRRLVVLRSVDDRLAEGGQSHLESLTDAGVEYISLDAQLLADLAAYQNFLTRAHNGKLLRDGKTVEVTEYAAWAGQHVTPGVRSFIQQVLSAATPAGKSSVPPPPATPEKPKAKAARAKK